MSEVCFNWGINCVNLSLVNVEAIGELIKASEKPLIIIASVEKVNDPLVQKQLGGLVLQYIAVDEAQVSLNKF